MNSILQIFFEYFNTFVENAFFFYFIARRLSVRPHFFRYAACGTVFFTIIAQVLHLFSLPSQLSLCCALFLEILFTLLLTYGTVPERIFWGAFFCVIDIVSEGLTYILSSFASGQNANAIFFTYPMRYITGLLYLALLFSFTTALARRSLHTVSLPFWILPFFVAMVICGIFAVETLLDVIIYMNLKEDTSQCRQLYLAILIFMFLFLFAVLLISYLSYVYQKNLELEEDHRMHQIEKQQLSLFTETVQMLRVWKHDEHHHLAVLEELLHNQKYQETEEYIHTINEEFTSSSFGIFTGDSILDAVISAKMLIMQNNNIRFDHSIYLPEKLPLDHTALSSMMGNLFDNAIEASLCLDDPDSRHIVLTIKPHQNSLSICMENNCVENYRYNDSHQLISTKSQAGHGIGLKRIRQIAESVGGFCQITPTQEHFTVNIIIPLGAL